MLTFGSNPSLSAENSFTTTFHAMSSLTSITLLSTYNCAMTPPTVVLTTNKVTAPTSGLPSGVTTYNVGAPTFVVSTPDFTVAACSAGSASLVLSYSISSVPASLASALSVAKNGATGKINISISSADPT